MANCVLALPTYTSLPLRAFVFRVRIYTFALTSYWCSLYCGILMDCERISLLFLIFDSPFFALLVPKAIVGVAPCRSQDYWSLCFGHIVRCSSYIASADGNLHRRLFQSSGLHIGSLMNSVSRLCV